MEKPFYAPSLLTAFKLLFLSLFIELVLSIVQMPFLHFWKLDTNDPWITATTSILSFLILIGWLGRKQCLHLSSMLKPSKVDDGLFIPVIITVVGGSIIASEIGNYMLLFFPLNAFWKELFSQFDPMKFGSGGVFFWVAITAPIIEEILHRGIILRGFLRHYSPKTAIFLSAFVFAIIHLNPWQFPAALILGLVFGWWFYKTRSLISCIVAHMFNNALPYLLMLTPLKISGYTTENPANTVLFQPHWFTLSGTLLFIFGIVWCSQFLRKQALVPSSVENL